MSNPPPSLRLAATCLPVRDGSNGLEVLMVRRNPELSFGGMWTFPGGTLEASDGPMPEGAIDEDHFDWHDLALMQTAAQGAVRETIEETQLRCAPASLAWFSHWIPPKKGPPKRFATWFFLAPEHSGDIVIDQSENSEGAWVAPAEAIARHASEDFPLSLPTWVTLDDLRTFTDVASLLDHTITQGARMHHTKALMIDEGRLVMWAGDAGYEQLDPAIPGARNRAIVSPSFEVLQRLRTQS